LRLGAIVAKTSPFPEVANDKEKAGWRPDERTLREIRLPAPPRSGSKRGHALTEYNRTNQPQRMRGPVVSWRRRKKRTRSKQERWGLRVPGAWAPEADKLKP